MGGSSRQRQNDAKMNRLTGSNVDVRGRDSKGGVASAKTWSAKERSHKAEIPQYVHRKVPPSKPHMGKRSLNPSMSVERAVNGYQAEKKHNDNVGLITPRFRTEVLRKEIGSRIASVCHDVAIELKAIDSKLTTPLLREFVSTFMMDGLMYLQLGQTDENGDAVETKLIHFFAKKYGLYAHYRMQLVKNVEFWKKICKEVGKFLCPRNNIIGSDGLMHVHSIPASGLRSASLSRIIALQRKGTPMTEEVQPIKGLKRDKTNKVRKYATLNLMGSGKGNSFIDSNVKNAGTGGKSKNDKPIGDKNAVDPDPNCTGTSDGKLEVYPLMENVPNFGDVDQIKSNFVGSGMSGKGNSDFIFNTEEVQWLNANSWWLDGSELNQKLDTPIGRIMHVDMSGAPFCGLVCVDTACGNQVNVDNYISRIGQNVVRDEEGNKTRVFTQDIIRTVGTIEFLISYCETQGKGVLFLVNDNGQFHFHSVRRSPADQYIVMVHEEFNGVGHWTLISKCHSDVRHHHLSGKYRNKDSSLFGVKTDMAAGIITATTAGLVMRKKLCAHNLAIPLALWSIVKMVKTRREIAFKGIVPRSDNSEVRNYIEMRERVKFQGMDQIVEVQEHYFISIGVLHKNLFKHDFYSGPSLRYMIDSVRSYAMVREIACAKDQAEAKEIASNHMLMGREINSRSDPKVFEHTLQVMSWLSECLEETETPNTRGLIMVNAPNSTAVIPNLEVIDQNFEYGAENLAGGGKFTTNMLEVKHDIPMETQKLDKPICVAPIGCPISDGKPVGAGLFSLTDTVGFIAASAGRGCSKEQVDAAVHVEFVESSIQFMDRIVDSTDLSQIDEESGTTASKIAFFVSRNKTSKTQKWISRRVKNYLRHKLGKMSCAEERKYKKYTSHIKFESNIKRVNGKVKVRPRLIMQMSDYMQFELCEIAKISDAWYDGPISHFQVKHMDPGAMIDKIRKFQMRNHCVTDYSAFESSITASVRKIEMHVIKKLLVKSGYVSTLRILNELMLDRGRTINHKNFDFHITTRCSGDYWTSLANGIVSISLMHYCHETKGLEGLFDMLAEGDDGLISEDVPDVELLKVLGFKFSSEVKGSKPGDTDFLRSLWEKRRYLNVGRILSRIFWVKKAVHLRRSKQKFLLRCAALSLHHMSPGHPVLNAVVRLIDKETRGCSDFKSSKMFLDQWKTWDMSGKIPIVDTNNDMRLRVLEGAEGFPGIPFVTQRWLEEKISNHDLNFMGVLNDFDDYKDCVDASKPSETCYNTDNMITLNNIIYEYNKQNISLTNNNSNVDVIGNIGSLYTTLGVVRHQPNGRMPVQCDVQT